MATSRARTAGAALTTVVLAGPVLYPAALAVATRRRPERPLPATHPLPALSVVVAAYHEAAVIDRKVVDTLGNGYPGEVEVLVVADDPQTAAAARLTGATVLEGMARQGKSAALGRGVAAARHDITVLTDANAFLTTGSLEALARWFVDPSVGAVAGEKALRGSREGAYWRFESWLKRRESRLGSTIGLVGELAAIRRSAWHDVPADVAVDDLWIALSVLDQGLHVLYEPAARAEEEPSAGVREEWERRTRVVAGMLDVVVRRRELLIGHGSTSLQLWGHRVVRSTAGPLAHVGLLGLAVASARRSRLAQAFLAGHALTAAAATADARGLPMPGLLRTAASVGLLQLVGLGGTCRYLRGDRPALWPKVERG